MTELKELWPVEPLSEAAKARLIKQAAAQPQVLPWPQTVAAAAERALSEWRYGLVYKMAAAVACVVMGLGIGLNIEPRDHDVAGLAFMNSTTTSTGEISE